MLFSEFYKIMVKKVTFVGFRGKGGDRPLLDPPLACTPCVVAQNWPARKSSEAVTNSMTKFRWAAVLRSFFCFHLRMKQLLDSKHRVCIWESCLLKRIFISFNKRLKLVKWQVHNVVNTQLLFAERAIQTPRPVLAAVPGGHAAESAGIETENTAVRGNRQRHLVLSKTEMKRPPAIQYRSTHNAACLQTIDDVCWAGLHEDFVPAGSQRLWRDAQNSECCWKIFVFQIQCKLRVWL